MSKKIIISLIVILIVVVVAGGFFWWQSREIKGSPEDYVIKETAEGKFMENKKAGLTVKVPEGWEVEKMEVDEGLVILFPIETKIEIRESRIVLPIEKGCLIRTTVVYREGDFNQIKKETRKDHFLIGGVIYDEFQEVTINNYHGLKNSFEFEGLGSGISIYIPQKNKVYGFHLVWGAEEKERCIWELNKFLETISIK